MLSSINRFESIFAKMVKYENEGKGGPIWGGYKLGGTAILNGKFLYHTEIFLGAFYVNL